MSAYVSSLASPALPVEAPMVQATRAWRLGLALSAAGLVALAGWAATAPLDEGVPAAGQVAVDTKRRAVQHATGGIVRQVLVGEGSVVREGQPLFILDDVSTRASMESMRQRYLGLRAMEARLVAERDGLAEPVLHADLRAALADPVIRGQWQAQQQLLVNRRAALRAELAGITESQQSQQAALTSARAMHASRQNQLNLLQEELGSIRDLVSEGYAPRTRQFELERQIAELRATLAELQGNQSRAERATAELQQRGRQRQEEFRKEASMQLADVLREVQADADKLRAASDELARMQVRAPAAGQVVGLAAQAVGSVVQPAQKLADIVPAGEALMLEVHVPPHVIDRVRDRQLVDVRFSGFSQTPQLVVEGEVRSVSADALTDPVSRQTYYLARVGLTAQGMQHLGTRQLQPGMPVEVVLRTGERSLLTYLLHPLTRRVSASMKEE